MTRAKKGVTSEGKGATPQEDTESDSSSKQLAKTAAMMEEKCLGFDKRLDVINRRLERLDQARSAGQAGVQEETSGE